MRLLTHLGLLFLFLGAALFVEYIIHKISTAPVRRRAGQQMAHFENDKELPDG